MPGTFRRCYDANLQWTESLTFTQKSNCLVTRTPRLVLSSPKGGTTLHSSVTLPALHHHGYEELTPTPDGARADSIWRGVDLSNTICKILGSGYRQPQETFCSGNATVLSVAEALYRPDSGSYRRSATGICQGISWLGLNCLCLVRSKVDAISADRHFPLTARSLARANRSWQPRRTAP